MTNDSTIGVRDVLIWLSGGDPELLEQSPADRARHIAYGMMFLVTAAFAAISGTFALNMMMHLSWPVAAIFGIGWGIMILAIDRMLVLSMPRPKGFRGFLVSTLTVALRVGMALVLGAVVSTPLILRVFEPEIAVEIQVMHAEEVAAYKQQLDADPRFSSMPDLRQEIAQQQAIVDAGLPPQPRTTPLLCVPGQRSSPPKRFTPRPSRRLSARRKVPAARSGWCRHRLRRKSPHPGERLEQPPECRSDLESAGHR